MFLILSASSAVIDQPPLAMTDVTIVQPSNFVCYSCCFSSWRDVCIFPGSTNRLDVFLTGVCKHPIQFHVSLCFVD